MFGNVPQGKIHLSVQDEGRTLKVFVSGKARIASGRLSGIWPEQEQREAVQIMTEAGTAIGSKNPSLKSRMEAALAALLERFELRMRG